MQQLSVVPFINMDRNIKVFTGLDTIEQARSGTSLQVPESLTVAG
jgi:hypothetical protein